MSTATAPTNHLDPALLTGEPFAGVADLARAIGVVGIARDARRLDERTRTASNLVGGELIRGRIFEQRCVRLHHHVETMWHALVWCDADEDSRVHSLTICRLLCETALDRGGDAFTAARLRLARDLDIERTKFLMATTVDACTELQDQIADTSRHTARVAADTIGHATVDRFRARVRPGVTAAITQVAHGTLRDLYAAFGDLARTVPELMFTLLDLETMPLLDRLPGRSR